MSYNDKTNFDPGRFRYKVSFMSEVSTPDGFGGSTVAREVVLSTLAMREEVRATDQFAVDAGYSQLNGACFFIIRNRLSFVPAKDMTFLSNNQYYTIKGVIPMGQPVRYMKVLCAISDGQGSYQ